MLFSNWLEMCGGFHDWGYFSGGGAPAASHLTELLQKQNKGETSNHLETAYLLCWLHLGASLQM